MGKLLFILMSVVFLGCVLAAGIFDQFWKLDAKTECEQFQPKYICYALLHDVKLK